MIKGLHKAFKKDKLSFGLTCGNSDKVLEILRCKDSRAGAGYKYCSFFKGGEGKAVKADVSLGSLLLVGYFFCKGRGVADDKVVDRKSVV